MRILLVDTTTYNPKSKSDGGILNQSIYPSEVEPKAQMEILNRFQGYKQGWEKVGYSNLKIVLATLHLAAPPATARLRAES